MRRRFYKNPLRVLLHSQEKFSRGLSPPLELPREKGHFLSPLLPSLAERQTDGRLGLRVQGLAHRSLV
jgi:hypothetical protein